MNPDHVQAELDQAHAAVRDVRSDGPAAERELRCVAPPTGCGQPPPTGSLATAFRDRASRAEYDITHMCQSCQDRLWAPSEEDILAMALDPRFERCPVCGEYRELEFIDVGVGTISGHDCCAGVRFRGEPGPGRCERTPGCAFGAEHFHGCEPYEVGGR